MWQFGPLLSEVPSVIVTDGVVMNLLTHRVGREAKKGFDPPPPLLTVTVTVLDDATKPLMSVATATRL